MKNFIIAIFVITLCGCSAKTPEATPVEITMNTPTQESCPIFIETSEPFTPFNGMALSSSSKVQNPMDFNTYFDNTDLFAAEMDISEDFPITHILQCMAIKKMPFITVNLDYSNLPSASELLEAANKFGRLNIPITVNLFPLTADFYEHKDLYQDYWSSAAALFHTYAPNTTLLCTISTKDIPFEIGFLPKSDYLEYIGLSHFQSWDDTTTLITALSFLSMNVPDCNIIISSFGISHYDTELYTYKIKEASEAIYDVLGSLKNYPQVKGIIYCDRDLSYAVPQLVKASDYRITTEQSLLEAYNNAITEYCGTENNGVFLFPENGIVCEGKAYLPESILAYNKNLTNEQATHFSYNNSYIDASSLNNAKISIEDKAIYITIS